MEYFQTFGLLNFGNYFSSTVKVVSLFSSFQLHPNSKSLKLDLWFAAHLLYIFRDVQSIKLSLASVSILRVLVV